MNSKDKVSDRLAEMNRTNKRHSQSERRDRFIAAALTGIYAHGVDPSYHREAARLAIQAANLVIELDS